MEVENRPFFVQVERKGFMDAYSYLDNDKKNINSNGYDLGPRQVAT